jgi:ribose-phosphate pyrophosphokinase
MPFAVLRSRRRQRRCSSTTPKSWTIGPSRSSRPTRSGVVSGDLFVGEVAGATALIIDDLISTGTTLVRAARSARQAGARRVLAMVTHGLFMPGAEKAISDPALDGLVVTDAVPPFRLTAKAAQEKVEVLPVAPLLAEIIRRLHAGRPLLDLLIL